MPSLREQRHPRFFVPSHRPGVFEELIVETEGDAI
jgi:hypothetical protein